MLALQFALMSQFTSVQDLGIAVSLFGAATAIVQTVDFGVSRRILRDAARPDFDIVYRFQERQAILRITLFLTMIVAALSVNLSQFAAFAATSMGLYVSCRAFVQSRHSAAQATDRFRASACLQVGERLCSLAIFVALLPLLGALQSMLASLGLSACVTAALSRRVLTPGVRLNHTFQRSHVKQALVSHVKYGRPYAASSVLGNLFQYDAAVVAFVTNATVAGYYGVGSRLTWPLLTIVSGLTAASIPVSIRGHKSFRQSILIGVAASWIGLAFMMLAAQPLVLWLFGPDYRPSISAARWLLVAAMFSAATQPIAALLQTRGQTTFVGWIMGCAVTMNLLAVGIGAHFGAASGAASALVITNGLTAAAILLRLAWTQRQRVPGRPSEVG